LLLCQRQPCINHLAQTAAEASISHRYIGIDSLQVFDHILQRLKPTSAPKRTSVTSSILAGFTQTGYRGCPLRIEQLCLCGKKFIKALPGFGNVGETFARLQIAYSYFQYNHSCCPALLWSLSCNKR